MSNSHVDYDRAEEAFEEFMDALGLDTDSVHMQRTAERVTLAYADELFRGLDEDPREHLERTFPAPKSDSYSGGEVSERVTDAGFVIQDSIQVNSMCEHHFLPFRGEAHVGYIPDEEIVGLSKLARVTEGFARRPQVQERLTNQVADAIHDELEPLATVVYVSAEHECMTCRGVEEPHSTTSTIALRGKARTDSHIKEEFFNVLGVAQR